MQLSSIEAAGDNSYRVTFSDAARVSERTFVFEMQRRNDIDVLTWGPDFSDFCGHNTGPLSALFSAVSSFHAATRLSPTLRT